MRSRTVTGDGLPFRTTTRPVAGRRGLAARWVALTGQWHQRELRRTRRKRRYRERPRHPDARRRDALHTADLQPIGSRPRSSRTLASLSAPREESYFGPRADSRNHLNRDRLGELEVSALNLEGVPVPGRRPLRSDLPPANPGEATLRPGTTCRTWHSVTQTRTLSASASTTCQR
jgi:hypothetical protein